MHNFTPEDVAAEGFDLALIKPDEAEFDRMIDVIKAKRESLVKENVAKGLIGHYATYIHQDKILSGLDHLGLCSEPMLLSFLFFPQALLTISAAIEGQQKVYYPAYHIHQKVYALIQTNPCLAVKIFKERNGFVDYRIWVIGQQLIPVELLLSVVKDGTIIKEAEGIQLRLLELCDGPDAPIFFGSDYEQIRLAAYKKAGPISNVDKMVGDKSWTIRQYAISILNPGDKRLAAFIQDKSLNVFCDAIRKIDSGLMPMMFGSRHMKHSRVKEIIKQRLDSCR